jgi:predicted GNAT family N-acyltransferase
MKVTELRASDLTNGFLEALKNLTSHVHLTPSEAKNILRGIQTRNKRAIYRQLPKLYHIFVVKEGKDVGATTTLFTHESWLASNGIFIEMKFIHTEWRDHWLCPGKVAHLGNIPEMIRRRKSKADPCRVMEDVLHEAQTEECYKVIVDCQEKKDIRFFEHYGFKKQEVAMRHKDFRTKREKSPVLIGHIEDVARIPDQRWKGSGRLVMLTAIERAREIGCEELVLDCEDDSKLVGFYESLGFEKCGVEMRLDLKIGENPLPTGRQACEKT